MCKFLGYFIIFVFTGVNKYLESCKQCIGLDYLDCMEEVLEHEGEWTERIYNYEGNRLLSMKYHIQQGTLSNGETGPEIRGNYCKCNELNFGTCEKEGNGVWDCDTRSCTPRCKLSKFDKDSRAFHYDCEKAFPNSSVESWSINDGSQCSNPYSWQMFPAVACKSMGWTNNYSIFFSNWDGCDNISGWMSYYHSQFRCGLWEHKTTNDCKACKDAESLEKIADRTIMLANLLKDLKETFATENIEEFQENLNKGRKTENKIRE